MGSSLSPHKVFVGQLGEDVPEAGQEGAYGTSQTPDSIRGALYWFS